MRDGLFMWDSELQGYIFSSYFWGYIVSLIPGGMVAEYVSAKWVMIVSVLFNVFASFLMPVAAKIHSGAFMAMRVIQGLGGVSLCTFYFVRDAWKYYI